MSKCKTAGSSPQVSQSTQKKSAGRLRQQDRSLANLLNRKFLSRLLLSFLIINLCILALSLGTYLFYLEQSHIDENWQLWRTRRLVFTRGADFPNLSFYNKLAHLHYEVENPAGEILSLAIGEFAQIFSLAFLLLLSLEIILLLRQYFVGKQANARILEGPLEEMAEQAELLSRMELAADRYHDLEDAIESVKPGRPGARIHTGDPNLQDIEDAINDLLTRTHEAYKQQIRFVSDASHELRTPIAVIQGYADMLARWGAEDKAVLEESIAAIRAETKQMQVLVEQLLFLARGDAGRITQQFECFNLRDLLLEVYEEYRMIDPDHNWCLRQTEDIELRGDVKLLKQVLRILCDNAQRYSEQGAEISLACERSTQGEAKFIVQDMGSGIPAADLPHIFERFYRSDPARKREGGSGLGLAIAKWIVDEHGGHFNVLSREGLGTRMTVVLPQP